MLILINCWWSSSSPAVPSSSDASASGAAMFVVTTYNDTIHPATYRGVDPERKLHRRHSNNIRRFDAAPSQRTTRGVEFTWNPTIVRTNQWGNYAVCCQESWCEEQTYLETRWKVLEDARRELRSVRINLRNGAKSVCRNGKSIQLTSAKMCI